jgi:hypothetical protein
MNQTTHDYWSFPSTLSWNGRNHIAVSARSYQCLRPHNLPSFMNHGSKSQKLWFAYIGTGSCQEVLKGSASKRASISTRCRGVHGTKHSKHASMH